MIKYNHIPVERREYFYRELIIKLYNDEKKGDKVLYYGDVYKVAYIGREYVDLKIPRRKYVMTVEKKFVRPL